jgi:hypothetical protein
LPEQPKTERTHQRGSHHRTNARPRKISTNNNFSDFARRFGVMDIFKTVQTPGMYRNRSQSSHAPIQTTTTTVLE